MSADALLERLAVAGVTLTAVDGYLNAEPAEALTDELRALIREHKTVLLALLGRRASSGWPNPMEAAYSPEATHAAEPITIPKRPAIPLSGGEWHRLRAWLDSIGETDLAVRAAVAEQCERDPAARRYYFELVPTARADDRRYCRECSNLTTRGVCIAARSIGTREGYQPTDDVPRRCEAFRAPEAEA